MQPITTEVDHANAGRGFPGHTSSSEYGVGQGCHGIIDSHGHRVLAMLEAVPTVGRIMCSKGKLTGMVWVFVGIALVLSTCLRCENV